MEIWLSKMQLSLIINFLEIIILILNNKISQININTIQFSLREIRKLFKMISKDSVFKIIIITIIVIDSLIMSVMILTL